MDTYRWKNEVNKWVAKRKSIKMHKNEIFTFFSKAFSFNQIPDNSYFDSTDSSISLLVGSIYLAAIVYTGNDKGIWLILDSRPSLNMDEIEIKPVLSTTNNDIKLFWFHTFDFGNLNNIIQNEKLWYTHSIATRKIIDTPKGYSVRSDFIANKNKLSLFWRQNADLIDSKFLDQKLEFEVRNSKEISKSQRLERLQIAEKKPPKIQSKITSFIRNPDVIAEVLDRSNGYCECCKQNAPFFRDSDNSPYLEIHHIIPLSKGGDDSVENAISLCPNCHRHAHFGTKSFHLS